MATRSATQQGSKKIVGVLYKGGEHAAQNPDFVGCVENALSIRAWLESQGHHYVVTDDKDGPDCELEKHIGDAHVLITTPFQQPGAAPHGGDRLRPRRPAGGRRRGAHRRRGHGQQHRVGGGGPADAHPRPPAQLPAGGGEWDLAAVAHRAYDLQGKTVGTVGAGRIGRLLLQRLKLFGCTLLYHDRLRVDAALEEELGSAFEEELDAMLPKCDVVVLNMPLTDKTKGMFDKEKIGKMKRGVIIVNNARGAIMDTQAVAEACKSGHIAGYGGDVWYPQPAPKDHPWRYMPNNAMTPHISGSTIDAQLRYAAGVKDMLERYFKGQDFPEPNYIVKEGKLASQYQ
ncbi:unnamed protein product [Triticum turgidum subsp. durum]|uniref:D-isomer specific 2-hydroxyacid dehydrogenase NAD-binding domain-containing protein n=1 Tax=Triticum turgidum subsp. durum TaxID=4567 RepID=A0A9R0XGT1_TRITD|nr:unnamed protein product [Triticum turgidum subsp. durum]